MKKHVQLMISIIALGFIFTPLLSYADSTETPDWLEGDGPFALRYDGCYGDEYEGYDHRYHWDYWTKEDNTCSYYDSETGEYVTKDSHEWWEWSVWDEPSCYRKGQRQRQCQRCYVTQMAFIPKTAHTWGAWYPFSESTSYVKGEQHRNCSICGEMDVRYLPLRPITVDEKKACAVVNKYMKAAKKYNIKKMNKCFAKKSKTYGYPTKKTNWIYKKYNKKIQWTIQDASTSGKTGKVRVLVTRPNFYDQAYDAMYETLDWAWDKWGVKASKHGNAVGNKLLKKYTSKVKKCKKTTDTKTVTFNMVKTSKGWKIKSKSMTIVDIATAYFNEAMEDAGDDWEEDFY